MTQSAPENLLADASEPSTTEAGGCGGHCSCGDNAEVAPELDARQIPPAIRHASIIGALSAVRPGGTMVLIAPHAPVPLLEQLEAAEPGVWTSTIAQSGPEEWRVRLTRSA